ncbi:Uncharacterized membrane protein [Kaistia soli DSM 19436]|uniref:Uncharacterized membrane protein n=1 Tax=Kaistia soli DSM 19436 TaxID=1122133 RepID=A0A1M5FSA0_9HYPH|nr:DUF502 domain-containing protein [Kaistia soli]SHF94346.1 Uncharacterized membrane protein [Kaistia soli DSM 19436]
MSLDEPQISVPVDSPGRRIVKRLRNYFLTGLVIAAPISITIYLTWSLIKWIDGWVKPVIPREYSPDSYLPFSVPGFGVLVAVIALTLLGFLTANFVGRTLVGLGESLVGRTPLVRNLYGALKQLFETVLSSKGKSFHKTALMEFPYKGVYAIVFIATETRGEIRQRIGQDGEEWVTVFLPPSPAPTAGFMLFVKRSELIELDMTVEEAAKVVLSAGLVTPEYDPARLHPALPPRLPAA